MPAFKTTKPIGIYPLSSSILATTAAYETFGCLINYSYILAVDKR